MIRKRTIIAIIITIVVIIATNKLWLIFKPMPVAIKVNKLILQPQNGTLLLDYKNTLNVCPFTEFDFNIFVIILVLTFLLSYRLLNYITDFKTIKGKSIIDIIFLTIFFLFLFIPMSKINQDEISVQENRILAKWQPIINQDGKINSDFGKNFNEWFNDRFYMRDLFIAGNYFINQSLQKKDVIQGEDNWLFLGWKNSVESYSNSKKFTNYELKKITDYLINIDTYCKQHNKKFYFIIIPDKSKIYGEFYSKKIKIISESSRTDQLIEYINKISKIKVIYPKERLILEKSNNKLLYYKTDTHWNLLGAYYGYEELMKYISYDFPKINIYKTNEFIKQSYDGDLFNMLPKELKKHDKTVYKIPNINNDELCTKTQKPRDIISCNNSTQKYNLLMFRDSFATSLIPYLSYTFKNSKYIWKYNVSPKEMENADVIVLEIVERNLSSLINSNME